MFKLLQRNIQVFRKYTITEAQHTSVIKRCGNTDATGFLQYADASVSISQAGDPVPVVGGIVPLAKEFPQYQVTRDEKEWEYVARLLPTNIIPKPPKQTYYASGWVPPKPNPSMKYYVKRTRNYMLPVHLKITHRGQRRFTQIKGIHGNIWELEKDLVEYLQPKNPARRVCTKIHEINGKIYIHGDHVSNTQQFLLDKNL